MERQVIRSVLSSFSLTRKGLSPPPNLAPRQPEAAPWAPAKPGWDPGWGVASGPGGEVDGTDLGRFSVHQKGSGWQDRG